MDLRKLTSAAERVVYDAGRHVLQERTGTVLVSDEHELLLNCLPFPK